MDEPFLPPAQPTDNPAQQPQKSARKTIFLWMLLIIFFIAIYNFLSPSPHAPAPPAHDCSGTSPFGMFATFLGGLVPLGLVIWYLRSQMKNGSKFNLLQEPALIALADGQTEKAVIGFRAVIEKYPRQTQYQSVARYSLALALLRQGKLTEAIDETIRVEKGAGLLWAAEIRVLAACFLGQLYGLRGQCDAAERWIEEARKRLGRASQRLHSAAQLRIAEAIVRCRQGRFDEAARGLDRDWRQIEGNLAVPYLRAVWLMRAFAAAQAGPRGDGSSTAYLSLLRGGVCDHLAVEWPELRTFLVANGLSTVA